MYPSPCGKKIKFKTLDFSSVNAVSLPCRGGSLHGSYVLLEAALEHCLVPVLRIIPFLRSIRCSAAASSVPTIRSFTSLQGLCVSCLCTQRVLGVLWTHPPKSRSVCFCSCTTLVVVETACCKSVFVPMALLVELWNKGNRAWIQIKLLIVDFGESCGRVCWSDWPTIVSNKGRPRTVSSRSSWDVFPFVFSLAISVISRCIACVTFQSPACAPALSCACCMLCRVYRQP